MIPFLQYNWRPVTDGQNILQSHLHCTILHCNILHCNILHCNILYCTILHCNILHCTTLLYTTNTIHTSKVHCTPIHCTALFCTALSPNQPYCGVNYGTQLCQQWQLSDGGCWWSGPELEGNSTIELCCFRVQLYITLSGWDSVNYWSSYLHPQMSLSLDSEKIQFIYENIYIVREYYAI